MRSSPAEVRWTKSSSRRVRSKGCRPAAPVLRWMSPPRTNTDVMPPFCPVCTTFSPGTSRRRFGDKRAARGLEIFRGENGRLRRPLLPAATVRRWRSRQRDRSAVTRLNVIAIVFGRVECRSCRGESRLRRLSPRRHWATSNAPDALVELVSAPQATCAPSTGRPIGSTTVPWIWNRKEEIEWWSLRRSPSKRNCD